MPEPDPSNSGVPSSRVQPGDLIAEKYEVERVLATGGMGVVLAAQHKQLKRRVALKFLLPELCQASDVVARFLREAQAMTTIQNEHVTRVLDVGTTSDGSPFMVMEYLEGEDLGQTLERRQRLSVTEAVEYVLQAMEALAEAHINGFVHRDLKPSNLFVTNRPDGSPLVKVLDFGISKAVANDGVADLTHAQGILGSPLYMSPEQIRSSRSVDVRADIWALGIILHELIAGRPPFEAEAVSAVLASIVADDPVPLSSVAPDAPPALSNVILRCLRRKREERYSTVAELATDLQPFASHEARLSIARIERVVAHHARMSTPTDLGARTAVKGLAVAATAHASQNALGSANITSPTAVAPVSTNRPSTDPESGFGKYRLLAVLGQGGMADVFLAVLAGPEGLGFSKLVVIKRLRSSLANDPEFISMLVDEARIAAKLNHPNCVQTHEVGVVANEYYICMEYLDGQPLNRILKRIKNGGAGVPLAFRLGMVRDMLAGVHHAHELADFDGTPLGLVHRDVTPQNVFVTYEGQVKVVDFGIAKAMGRATETGQGIVKGKVAYMAPEQASGQDIDRRVDVFAAGVVLWELLTGQRMWAGVDDVAIIQKVLLDKIPASPRAVNPEVPKALDAMVRKALSRKKQERFETARAFQLEIERYMESEGLKCAPHELGEWVGGLFADRRKQTRSLIEAQLSTSRSGRLMDLRDGGATPNSVTPSGMRLERLDREPVPDENLSQPESVMARSHPGQPTTSQSWAPRAKSRWAIGAGVVVVGAMIVVGSRSRPFIKGDAPPAPSTSAGPSGVAVSDANPTVLPLASSAPPQAENLHVLLTAQPPNAEFAIDDEPKAKGPINVTRPRDNQMHRITVTANGFRPETKSVKFDQDVTWAAQLSPVHGSSNSGSRPSNNGTTAPTPSANAASTTPTAAPAGSGRHKRELDPDNPYAGQEK
jgi:serine/threonine protein kinase